MKLVHLPVNLPQPLGTNLSHAHPRPLAHTHRPTHRVPKPPHNNKRAKEELSKNVLDVEPVAVEALLELALRTSPVSDADPFAASLTFQLLPYSVINQVGFVCAVGHPIGAARGRRGRVGVCSLGSSWFVCR